MNYRDNNVPVQVRPPSVVGCSLAPWREWLEEDEVVREQYTRYPVDKPKGWVKP
jgi:hypothetical protein